MTHVYGTHVYVCERRDAGNLYKRTETFSPMGNDSNEPEALCLSFPPVWTCSNYTDLMNKQKRIQQLIMQTSYLSVMERKRGCLFSLSFLCFRKTDDHHPGPSSLSLFLRFWLHYKSITAASCEVLRNCNAFALLDDAFYPARHRDTQTWINLSAAGTDYFFLDLLILLLQSQRRLSWSLLAIVSMQDSCSYISQLSNLD